MELDDDSSISDATASAVDRYAAPDGAHAFANWVSPHLGLMTALAAHEVGQAGADDVVQEALLRAWRRRSTFDAAKGSARVWLLAILLDRARRHRVRTPPWQRSTAGSGRTDGPGGERPDPAAQVDAERRLDRLDIDAALHRLPRRQRQVVSLHYLVDLSVTDVAGVLGISVGTVKSQLFDARKALLVLLEDR